jgi:hypothetical protein
LKITFFEDFFKETVSSFYRHFKPNTFKNYRVWACDTTCQLLPDNEETRKIGIHKNQFKEVASLKISVYFDIANKLITQFALFDKRKSDLLCCIENQVKNVPKDVIAIYDRGYCSQILPFFHGLYGSKYVIRLRLDFSNTVKKFVESTANDILINEPMSEKTYKRLEGFGIRKSKKDTISYRLVKVILNTGEVEILITNLDSSFGIDDLCELYRLRWGIESCFFCLKSFQMLGTFSGYSKHVIEQDIYTNLLFYNFQTIAQIEADKKARQKSTERKNKENKNRKTTNLGYLINRNIGAGIVRMYLASIFSCKERDLERILKEMDLYFLQSLEKIKPNCKERKRKMHRQNDRHHTEMNYKRSF